MAVRYYNNFSRGPYKYVFTRQNWIKLISRRGFTVTSVQWSDENCNKDPQVLNFEKAQKDILEEPTNCCMSGCANCVWIKYAEQLIEQFDDGGNVAKKLIFERVQDPNMRAFLEMELRTMAK